jgi:hypothetical protein
MAFWHECSLDVGIFIDDEMMDALTTERGAMGYARTTCIHMTLGFNLHRRQIYGIILRFQYLLCYT